LRRELAGIRVPDLASCTQESVLPPAGPRLRWAGESRPVQPAGQPREAGAGSFAAGRAGRTCELVWRGQGVCMDVRAVRGALRGGDAAAGPDPQVARLGPEQLVAGPFARVDVTRLRAWRAATRRRGGGG